MAETTGEQPAISSPSRPISLILLGLRLALGWHFLYEGVAKLLIPGWTSAPYLLLSHGTFSGFFHWLGSSPGLLRAVDFLNIWGLILIGLALIVGCFCRVASASGIVLLALYYFAHPPFIQSDFRIPLEGHYLVIDKNFVEALALLVFLVLPSDQLWGVGRLLERLRAAKSIKAEAEPGKVPEESPGFLSRRKTLEDLVALPVLGVMGYTAQKKYKWEKVHAITGATIKVQEVSLKDLKGTLPQGNLGKFKVSRLILGGNLIGGWSHARDMIYASTLFKAYNSDRKVFETLEVAERAGINTFLVVNIQMPLFKKYRRLYRFENADHLPGVPYRGRSQDGHRQGDRQWRRHHVRPGRLLGAFCIEGAGGPTGQSARLHEEPGVFCGYWQPLHPGADPVRESGTPARFLHEDPASR